jgi:hypothetical protein
MHTNQRVDTRQVVAATRIIPLMIRAEGIALVEDVCGRDFPVIQIKPFASLNIGTLTTGSEVHKASVFDLVFPRLLAGDSISKASIVALGHGRLCSLF